MMDGYLIERMVKSYPLIMCFCIYILLPLEFSSQSLSCEGVDRNLKTQVGAVYM